VRPELTSAFRPQAAVGSRPIADIRNAALSERATGSTLTMKRYLRLLAVFAFILWAGLCVARLVAGPSSQWPYYAAGMLAPFLVAAILVVAERWRAPRR
jgi:hypothetical protein